MVRRPFALALGLFLAPALGAQSKPTIAQFLNPASPLELTSAHKADRVAWVAYDQGLRNVYTAAAPDFRAVRLTRFLKDDGVDLTDVQLSDDGGVAVFVRGSAPNRIGWVANPSHDPSGGERAIWAVRTTGGGAAWRVAVGAAPELSPDGRWVLYVKDGQIFRARVVPNGSPATMSDTGGRAFLTQWGRQTSPKWSPDGSRIAFVSERDNHALIGVYDTRTKSVEFVSPSVDCDAMPTWSADGKQLAFVRRPGVPFGAQAQQGSGGIGNPGGPAATAASAGRTFVGCGGGGFGGGGGGAAAATAAATGRGGRPGGDSAAAPRRSPGLYTATFANGSSMQVMVADLSATPKAVGGYPARELWHTAPGERKFTAMRTMMWAGDALIFPLTNIQGDEWDRYYAISLANPAPQPTLLTTTDGLIEDATSAALSKDGRTLYYTTNASDVERRHIWAVPTSGGAAPAQLTKGDGIEMYPQPLASGKQVAVLYYGVRQPASVGLVPNAGGETKIIFPTLPKDFPAAAHVAPQIVTTKAADGLEIHNQLFLPADLKPGERRPALVFVHGGPQRQMLPGYHYMQFYH